MSMLLPERGRPARRPLPEEFFVSYQHDSSAFANQLGAALQALGDEVARVFLYEWGVPLGGSIPHYVNNALERCDTFILLWSSAAAASPWVRQEWSAAVERHIRAGKRLIPVRIDGTELPPLIAHHRYADLRQNSAREIAAEILGYAPNAYTIAAQQHLHDQDAAYFDGYGVALGCPHCGAHVSCLRPTEACSGHDVYRGFKCSECGHSDGGEVF